jgi:hypothetical protein
MADLSPAAQAVLDAYNRAPIDIDLVRDDHNALAAALRAATDQVVPEDDPKSFIPGAPRSYAMQRRTTRAELLAIAAELEGNAAT